MAHLEIESKPDVGKQINLSLDRMVMGRHPDCHIQLEVSAVSRQHAALLKDRGDWYVEDLNSRNGTYVNESPIQGKTKLFDGDRIRICDVVLIFLDDRVAQLLPSNESRVRIVINHDTDLEMVVGQLREKFRSTQLVFCVSPDDHPLNLDLVKVDSTARRHFSGDFGSVVVLDALRGIQPDGSFSVEEFYKYAYSAINEQLKLDLDGNHHEQEIVQILRDISRLILCVIHFDRIPSDLFSRVRCLIQEGHSSLVCYSLPQSSRPGDVDSWLEKPNSVVKSKYFSREIETGASDTVAEIGPKPPSGKMPRRPNTPVTPEHARESAAEILKKFLKRNS